MTKKENAEIYKIVSEALFINAKTAMIVLSILGTVVTIAVAVAAGMYGYSLGAKQW